VTARDRGAVVITGTSTGIGAAAAETFAREGYVVFAGVRNDTDGARTAALHPNIRPVMLDVTDRVAIDAAAETVAASGLPLRGVINNAGIAVAGPLELLPIDELRRQFEVNVFGALAVSQAFLPQLRASHGRLIFVGSISGRFAVPFIAPYSASKFALRAFVDALRIELKPAGVAVVLLEPGSVQTPIWEKGRTGHDRVVSLLGPRAIPDYGPQIDVVFNQTPKREAASGIPVEHVSKALLRALTVTHPRAHYLVGAGARLGSILALLPSPLRDRILRRSMGLP
jgi:NAD(P)-dependent dehydrogenase (short-subunit alcohol dehydrogenase family)